MCLRPHHLDEGVGSLAEDCCGPKLVGAVARTPVPGLHTAFAGLVDTLPTLLPDPVRTPGPVQPKKIRPLEKKLGRNPATPQIIQRSAVKYFFYKFLGQYPNCDPNTSQV